MTSIANNRIDLKCGRTSVPGTWLSVSHISGPALINAILACRQQRARVEGPDAEDVGTFTDSFPRDREGDFCVREAARDHGGGGQACCARVGSVGFFGDRQRSRLCTADV